MGIFSEIEEIEEQIAKISGVGKIRQLEYSLQLFKRNYGMLSVLLSHIVEDKEKHTELFNRINKWKTELLFKEIAFRLHNFVASSFISDRPF